MNSPMLPSRGSPHLPHIHTSSEQAGSQILCKSPSGQPLAIKAPGLPDTVEAQETSTLDQQNGSVSQEPAAEPEQVNSIPGPTG